MAPKTLLDRAYNRGMTSLTQMAITDNIPEPQQDSIIRSLYYFSEKQKLSLMPPINKLLNKILKLPRIPIRRFSSWQMIDK